MQVTIIGALFFGVSVIFCFKKIEYISVLTIIATIFHSTSFIWIGESRITLFEICSLFLIIKFLFSFKKISFDSIDKLLLLFLVLVWTGTVISSFVFSGMIIDNFHAINKVIYHDDYRRIALTGSTVIALLRLSLKILLFFIIRTVFRRCDNREKYMSIVIKFSLFVVLSFGLFQYVDSLKLFDFRWLITLVHDSRLVPGDAYYSGYDKLFSIFREPSYCGPWLNAFFWALVISKHKLIKNNFVIILIFIELVLTVSSTAVVSFVAMQVVYAREIGVNKNSLIRILLFISLLVLCLLSFDIFNRNLSEVISKLSSTSGIERVEKIRYCYELFLASYLFGVGFHQVESMSLFSGLLAQVGIVGSLVFCYALFKIIRTRSYNSVSKLSNVFILSIVISTELSCPGLLYVDTFWFGLYLWALCVHRDSLLIS